MGTEKRETGSRRRSGAADDQEQRSVGQLIERLAELGWKPQGPRKDYGEDFLVQIWDEGQSTGLSFYVQLKSVRDAELRKGKRKPDALKYRLEVKDLEHWEKQTLLVVLLVWDVEKRQGYWETVPRLVEALEKKGKGWRKKGTVTVEVPASQTTDDGGMQRLRWAVADYSLALVSGRGSEEENEFTIRFVDGATFKAFSNALDRGDEVAFEGLGVPQIEMPMWHRRLYGVCPPPTQVTITPQVPDVNLTVRIEVRSRSTSAAFAHVELRPKKYGRKHITLSNGHQGRTISFFISSDEAQGGDFRFRQERFGKTIQEAREVAAFFFAANQPGSRIRVVDERTGAILFELPIPPRPQNLIAEGLCDTLEKLAVLEPFIERFGTINLDEGLTDGEIVTIAVLHAAHKSGQVRMRKRLSYLIDPDADELPNDIKFEMTIERAGCKLNLLGVEVPLGRMKETILEPDRVASAMKDALAEARATGKPVPVHIDDVLLVAEFLDWPHRHDRLYDIAASQSGYFTLAQALEAGFTSAEQLQIEERVEPHGGDVFRLVQFPSIEENEDHIVTWLLTDKKAIFSHDTALALHELSDILPTRQHITLPPDWSLPEGIELPAHVVVHRGNVEPSEMTWMGPVPFTKPLRTILDCIEKGVSPDLIDQAIEQAHERWLISDAEAQGLQAARAKSA